MCPHCHELMADTNTNTSPLSTWSTMQLKQQVPTKPLIGYIDVYINNFVGLAQGFLCRRIRIRSLLLHAAEKKFHHLTLWTQRIEGIPYQPGSCSRATVHGKPTNLLLYGLLTLSPESSNSQPIGLTASVQFCAYLHLIVRGPLSKSFTSSSGRYAAWF